MYGPNEEMLKNMAAQTGEPVEAATLGGYAGIGQEPARPSLMERVHQQRKRAQREAIHAERLAELQMLLEKNPEIAHILDLLDWLKY